MSYKPEVEVLILIDILGVSRRTPNYPHPLEVDWVQSVFPLRSNICWVGI